MSGASSVTFEAVSWTLWNSFLSVACILSTLPFCFGDFGGSTARVMPFAAQRGGSAAHPYHHLGQQQLRPCQRVRPVVEHKRSCIGRLAIGVDRAVFPVQYLDTTHGDARRCTVTTLVSASVRVMVIAITPTVRMSSAPMLPTMEAYSLAGRCA